MGGGHHDANAKNIGFTFGNFDGTTKNLTITDIQNSHLHLFDYDKCRPVRLRKPGWLKLFFDLRCLSVVHIQGLSDADIVRLYLQVQRTQYELDGSTPGYCGRSFLETG